MLPPVKDLFSQYGGMVLRRARALLGDEAMARDAAQEVFLQVLRAEDGFRNEASPVTWLYRITTNVCLNLIKQRTRRSEETFEVPEEAAAGLGVEERLAIHSVLARVPEPLREIATYYYLDQLSHDEIAQLCNVSRRTVGNRLVEFREAANLLTLERRRSVS